MDADWHGDIPCSSLAVNSIINASTGGLIWGLCIGPYDANRRGLTGINRASFVTKAVGRYGFQCGLFAGVFSFTHCGIRRYRGKNDWVNSLVAGGVAGAAIGAGTRNWKNVSMLTAVLSVFCAVTDPFRDQSEASS